MASHHRVRGWSSGQGITELVLLLPVLLILLVAVVDFARLISTTISVEAAAREAADYGTLYPWQWEGDGDEPISNTAKTVSQMERRACVATSRLPDYQGPDTSCANPVFAYQLNTPSDDISPADCHSIARSANPCEVEVSITYVFHLLVPLNVEVMGMQLGFPSTVTITRGSVFAVSDFAVDGT